MSGPAWITYLAVRYGTIAVVAAVMIAMRTSLLRVALMAAIVAVLMAAFARRRVGPERVGFVLSAIFEMPYALGAAALGSCIGFLFR